MVALRSVRLLDWRCYLKQIIDSYSANLTFTQTPSLGERVTALVPPIPHHVWLAMILLAATLLGSSTLWRARAQVTTAQNIHAATNSRLVQAQAANAELKAQTDLLRTDSRAAAQAVQEQLHYVKPNEIVIATQ